MIAVNIKSEELRQRIRIRCKASTGVSEKGHPVKAWMDLGAETPEQIIPRWAKWQWLHGKEFLQAAAVHSEAVAEVTIRFVKGVTSGMEVIFKEIKYEILPPIDNILEQNRFITFKVKTIGPG